MRSELAQDFLQLVKTRRSVRKFKPEPIPSEHIEMMLEAIRWAPSAGNLQPWQVYVVKSQHLKLELARAAYNQLFIAEAPVVMVLCAVISRTAWRYGKRGLQMYIYQDVAAATQNLLLMAHALGYGACWVGAFSDQQVAEILNLSDDIKPMCIVPIGYPAEQPAAPPRLPVEKIVNYL